MAKGYSIDIVKKKSVSPVCRGSYVNILEAQLLPKDRPTDPDKYAWGLQCLFPKSDPDVIAWVKELSGLYAQVLIDKHGKEKAIAMAPGVKTPLRDGDDPKEADKELQGYYFMNTNNKFRQPFVIGAMGKPVDPSTLTVDDIYSGAWYRVMLEFWWFQVPTNKGISSSVVAIMKVRDDENLGGGTTKNEAENSFGDFADEAASIMTGATEEVPVEDTTKDDANGFNFM